MTIETLAALCLLCTCAIMLATGLHFMHLLKKVDRHFKALQKGQHHAIKLIDPKAKPVWVPAEKSKETGVGWSPHTDRKHIMEGKREEIFD